MNLGQYLRMSLRESRRSRGRIALFMACIAVGVAAIVVVAGLSASVNDGVRSEGRQLMAGDVSVEGRRPLPDNLDDVVARFEADTKYPPGAVQRADLREFVSVVLKPGSNATQLAEMKAVQGGYPFYGRLRLDPDKPLQELLSAQTVVVAQELLAKMDTKVGEELTIGGAAFRIAGAVLEEPDKVGVSFTLGPRVFLSPEALARTALLDRGARVEYRALLKLPEGTTAEDATRLERHIASVLPNDGTYRARSFLEAQPALRRSFSRMGRYLGLVGLLSLLVGGVGVAQVARAWLASRMDSIAILRCIGVRPAEVVLLYLVQVLAMALLASAAGAAIGTGLQWLVPRMLGGLLPEELIDAWQPAAVLRGVALGMVVATVFTLPLLIGLRGVPPVRVLRRDAEPVRPWWVARAMAFLLVLGGTWAAATWQAESALFGMIFVAGLVAVVGLLALVAAGLGRLARLVPRDAGGLWLRHGLTHLARPGAASVGAIVALGLGVCFIFTTRVVERHLSEQLRAEQPADAPTTFFLDVQPDQWAGIEALLRKEGATGIDSKPIVTARFTAVNGVPVRDLASRPPAEPAARTDNRGDDGRPRSRGWVLTREQRLTYGPELPRGNRVIAGAFPSPAPGGNSISVEEGFARDLGVGVGSTLTLDVQGVPVEMTVTSLRTVDWRTFGINFFLFAEPGPLNDAPHTRVAVARIPSGELPRVQAEVIRAYPNVTVIHIKDVMDKVLAILENLGIAVKALGAFTVIAGVVVLGGTVAATQARRSREVALLKTVGMTRRDVTAVYAIEYALTGTVAAAVGIGAGGMLAWSVITRLMELPWSPSLWETTAALLLTVALAIGAGLVASTRALRTRPIEVLRSE